MNPRQAAGQSSATRNILALDTCFEACSAAVGVGMGGQGQRIASRFEPMATGQAERIMPMIAEVMGEAGLAMAALDMIAVTTGPGSFTGTRIGLAAAKGLALALGIPAAGLTSLNAIARQAAVAAPGDCDILVAIDMGREEIYAQLFDAQGITPRAPPELTCAAYIEEIARAAGARLFGRGERFLPEAAMPHTVYLPNAETLVVLVTQCKVKLQSASPLYLRPPDAKPPRAGAIGRRA